MSKFITNIYKLYIIDYCNKFKHKIDMSFNRPIPIELYLTALNPKNWKCIAKFKSLYGYKDGYVNVWVRTFDCITFNSRLKATVVDFGDKVQVEVWKD